MNFFRSSCVYLIYNKKGVKMKEITDKIIGCAIEVHRELGPGLLESSYENCLKYLLLKEGLDVRSQVGLTLKFHDVNLEIGYRIDLLVENKIILEIKSVDNLNDIHLAQILTYMKLSKSKLGYLMNFNVTLMKDGLRRVVNSY